jgi:predicted nucleic acid-binding protein
LVNECVLDTDVVIAALDGGDAHHRAAARALKRMAEDGTRLLVSPINYAEALVRPAASADALRAAVDAIRALGIELAPSAEPVARRAAGLRHTGISLADSFALATALNRRATLASFDRRVRRSARAAGAKVLPAAA